MGNGRGVLWFHVSGLPVLLGRCSQGVRGVRPPSCCLFPTSADQSTLFEAVERAQASLPVWRVLLRRQNGNKQVRAEHLKIEQRLATLTAREKEVLRHIISGKPNKQVAADLGVVEKTIKVHRGRIMTKMKVRSLAELVRVSRAGRNQASSRYRSDRYIRLADLYIM